MKSDDELRDVIRDVIQETPSLDTARVMSAVAKKLEAMPHWSAHTEPRCQKPSWVTHAPPSAPSASYQRDWLRMLIAEVREDLAKEKCPACGHVLPPRSVSEDVATLEKRLRAS